MYYNKLMPFVRALRWDPWNVNHIAAHGVTINEVEEVCTGAFMSRLSYSNPVMIIGPTLSGRFLSVVLEATGEGSNYVVTARPSSRRERRLYAKEESP